MFLLGRLHRVNLPLCEDCREPMTVWACWRVFLAKCWKCKAIVLGTLEVKA